MLDSRYDVSFAADRVTDLLDRLERLVAHDQQARLQISPAHDELDAIAFGINALADELRWIYARLTDAERAKAEALREELIKRSAANFATAFHSNPCLMAIARIADGRFEDVNASFERHTGYRRDDVVGRTIGEVGMWVDFDDFAAAATALNKAGKIESLEVRYRTRSGALSTAVCSADVIQFGDARCVLASALDVTERRQTETQNAQLREELAHLARVSLLDTLTGSLAHEINQPLTAVANNAEAALRCLALEPPRWREITAALEDIRDDSQRASDVVRRLRALLKKHPPQRERIDISEAIADVVRLSAGYAAVRRVGLEVELPAAATLVIADRTQVQQVVLNLVINALDAVQHQPAADRRVRLRAFHQAAAAVIEVSDRGPAITDEALAQLFEPFYTTKREGLGVGLPICRAIVVAHGGTIEARRHPGHGLTFSVTLPVIADHGTAEESV